MKKWNEIRAKAIRDGRFDELKLKEGTDRMIAAVRAHKLAELRSNYGLRQEDMAKRLNISQSRVSRIERGDLEQSQLSTLRAYANALGGELELVVRVGDERITIA